MKQVPSEEKKFVRRAVLISTLLMAALFAAAVTLYLNRGALLNKHAQNAAERGDYEQAISVLEDSDVQVDPEQMAEYRYRLALSYLEDGRLSDAETLFSQLSVPHPCFGRRATMPPQRTRSTRFPAIGTRLTGIATAAIGSPTGPRRTIPRRRLRSSVRSAIIRTRSSARLRSPFG